MNNLSIAIKTALESSGESKEANKAYLEFIKANFIIPIELNSQEEEPVVLYIQEGQNTFLPVFSEMNHLNNWAKEISDQIKLLKLSGVDLLKGIGENVTVCLDIGSDHYKEFNSSEIERMRSMILKLFKD